MHGAFPVRLRGGHRPSAFEVEAVADNVSKGGLHMEVPTSLALGASVFGVLSLPSGSAIAARGRVVRVETMTGGQYGVAVQFTAARLMRNERG